MGWNGNLLTAPISIGDVSTACHYSSNDLGSCIKNGGDNINVMAKYKPVKFNKPTLSAAERESVRYGMSAPPNFVPSTNNGTLPPAWTYNRPTAGAPNEWFRMLDFDGYDENAVQPVAITVYNFGIRRKVGVMVWKDSYVNTYYSEQQISTNKLWKANQSLSVTEILNGGDDYADCKIAFCIYNTNSSHKGVNLVVTNKVFGDISNNELFYLNGGDQYTDGLAYPKIPILYDTTYSGDDYIIAICLCRRTITTGNAYDVITNPNFDCYSLGFDVNNLTDRVTVKAESGYDLSHVSVSNFTVTETSHSTYDSTWTKCNISNASLTLSADSNWEGTAINLQLTLGSNDIGQVYNGSAIVGTATVTENKAISKNQSKSVTITISNYSFLVPTTAGSGNGHATFTLSGYVGENSQNKVQLATLTIPLTW